MGGWFSYLWWGGDPDAVDPFSELTLREICVVQKSWAVVHTNILANGTEIFRRLFNQFPETKEFFTMVRNMPEEKYTNSPQFKAHVINLMTSLNMAIINLNQPEVAAAIMNKLGKSHTKRKVKKIHFMDFKRIMMQMFIEDLRLDKDTQAAWCKVVRFLYNHIFETLTTNTTESS